MVYQVRHKFIEFTGTNRDNRQPMQVPFIDLKRGFSGLESEIVREWEESLRASEFIGGAKIQRLETEMARHLDVSHFVSCANGTDALQLGLRALGVGPGTVVALPNLTFWATFEAVVNVGATALLVDIDPSDLHMDFDEFKRAHEKHRFDVAVFVHLMGWTSARLEEFRGFCHERKIRVLDDSAQAFGVKVGGQSIFRGAQLSTLSFYPAKVLGGAMDGGGLATQDAALADQVRTLGNHGRKSHYSYSAVGYNSRMSVLQSRFLLQMLGRVDQFLDSRNKGLAVYRSELSSAAAGGKLKLHLPPAGVSGNGYLAVIECLKHSGEEVGMKLKVLGVGTGRVYPETIDVQVPAKDAIKISSLQKSKDFCARVVNLPLFAGITEEECRFSAQALLKVLEGSK